ncbi:MAG: hypothetical protein ACYS15_06400 [Planctomycetota bacterium]
MFEPLIKLGLSKLDPLIDAYVERQRIILMIAGPGTLLFLLLFWAFSGAGGLMLFLGLLLIVAEAVLAGGIFLLNEKYKDEIRQWMDAADAIEAFLTHADVFSEWTQFLATPQEDRRLEQLRINCTNMPKEYPPEPGDEYCGQEGLNLLESYVKQLRVGVATKAAEDFGKWRAGRDERKARKSERKTAAEAKAEAKARSKAGARAGAQAKAAAKQEAAEAKARMRAQSAPIQHVATLSQEEQELAPEPRRKVRKPSRRAAKAAKKQALKAAKRAAKKRPKAKAQTTRGLETERRQSTGMVTEAAALQQIMDAGYTAHDYDRKQEQIVRQQGRVPTPAEVVRGLVTEQKQKAKIAKGKGRRGRKAARKAKVKVRHGEGVGKVRWMRVVVVLGAIVGAPFAVWRIPQYKSRPIAIIGEVYYEVLDRPEGIRHQLRTPFEELFGNKPVTLVDGRRIYVSKDDHKRCWPESWDAIYEKNYTMRISAKARPLYFNDYSVAEVTTVKRLDHPVARAR